MIAYFDTSALVALLVDEPGTVPATRLWDAADRVVSTRLLYAEARAALAMAERLGRTDVAQRVRLVADLDALYAQVDRVDVDDDLVGRAGDLADDHGLRGCDAVHMAACQRIADPDTVMVSGDVQVCATATQLGIAVANTSCRA